MTCALSAQGVDSCHARGYLFPLPVLSPDRAATTVGEIHAFEAAHPETPKRTLRHDLFRFKPHLIFTWLDSIVHAPAILDAVEGIIGPDIAVWARCCSSRTRATRPTSGTGVRQCWADFGGTAWAEATESLGFGTCGRRRGGGT